MNFVDFGSLCNSMGMTDLKWDGILEKKYESPSIFLLQLMATDFRKYVTLEIKVAPELAE